MTAGRYLAVDQQSTGIQLFRSFQARGEGSVCSAVHHTDLHIYCVKKSSAEMVSCAEMKNLQHDMLLVGC